QGLGGHGGYYKALASHLAAEGTVVIAPDLRGHGRSEGTRGDIDRFDRYLEDVDTAVTWARTCWPNKPVILLGESMGASIAIQYIATIEIPLSGRKSVGLPNLKPVCIAGLVL